MYVCMYAYMYVHTNRYVCIQIFVLLLIYSNYFNIYITLRLRQSHWYLIQ